MILSALSIIMSTLPRLRGSRHIVGLRAQLLGAVASGWALSGCGGNAESLELPSAEQPGSELSSAAQSSAAQSSGEQAEAEEEAERSPERPARGLSVGRC